MKTAADTLLEIEAVHEGIEKPFKFTSGTLSPVYVDCRKPISYPESLSLLICDLEGRLRDLEFDTIAGGETAGIPYASILAFQMKVPMVYVRKRPKGFGTNAQIEGEFKPSSKVVLIEDLMFDAQSKINFAEALRLAGGEVVACASVFDYGISASKEKLRKAKLSSICLASWEDIFSSPLSDGYFKKYTPDEIRLFLSNPQEWTQDNCPNMRNEDR